MSFLCWIGPGIFPSGPCKVVLDQTRWHTQGVRCWLVRDWRFRGGTYALASLVHMAHGRGRCEFQMFADSVSR
jgi:hypothetical protein